MTEHKQAIVLGCGVSGLSSAIKLQEAGYEVEIWARDLPPHTTSNRAAAIWYPYQVAPLEKVLSWGQRGYEAFCELADVAGTGVSILSGIEALREFTPAPAWSNYVRNFRKAAPSELPPGYGDGYYFDAPLIETSIYLMYLMRRFVSQGGRIVQREVKGLDAALAQSALVINCTGLGSRDLLGDTALFPIRGQIMRVTRPAINKFYVTEAPDGTATYIVPRSGDCILGGTAEVGNWSLEPEPATAISILTRCAQLQPAVQETELLEHQVGLRPGRPLVRLEAEPQPSQRLVIHNYGHGGAGVTLSWGCAEGVVKLVQEYKV